jgi:hypothetical protein
MKGIKRMTEKIRQQILTIRATGKCNMLDTYSVQYLANQMNFYELVIYVEEHRKDYTHFIMTGKIRGDN